MLEFELISQLVLLFVGFCIGLIIDILWWVHPTFKKAEKGLEVLEHFHISQLLFIAFIIVGTITKSDYALILAGTSVAFFLAEWSQSKEISGTKVIPGHPFSYGSSHFNDSVAIGFILGIISVITYFLIPLL